MSQSEVSMDESIRLHGQIEKWPNKTEMADLFKAAGLTVYVGQYSIRLKDCEHFVFQEYGFNAGEPLIEADASTLEKMLEDGSRVSEILANAHLRHRFELWDDTNKLVGYIHHLWPQQ